MSILPQDVDRQDTHRRHHEKLQIIAPKTPWRADRFTIA